MGYWKYGKDNSIAERILFSSLHLFSKIKARVFNNIAKDLMLILLLVLYTRCFYVHYVRVFEGKG